ncbi:MAG: adenylate kinase family protein [Thermoplasmata archaeon]|nr:adenylate kinase family protein [Thermoplasmata archaeon]
MKVALTGTPGVGKTCASSLVGTIEVVSVHELAEKCHAVVGFDEERDTVEVDIDTLADAVSRIEGDVMLEGHLSHLLGVEQAIVLRCSPTVLRQRLAAKGWSDAKVRENVEAEAIDVILIEAIEAVTRVCEIDTSSMRVEDVARAIEEILSGESEKYPVGHVDWSQEVFDWF